MLGDGKLLEFDSPQVLLSNAGSHFSSMVRQSGLGEAEHLRGLANTEQPSVERQAETVMEDEETMDDGNETAPFLASESSV